MTSWIFSPRPDPDDDRRRPFDVLSVTLEMQDELTVVRLDGPVCAFTAPYLDDQLRQVEQAGRHRLVIDIGHVRPLCAAGLEVLVDHADRCTAKGGELAVRDPNPGAARVLSVCELEHLISPRVAVGA